VRSLSIIWSKIQAQVTIGLAAAFLIASFGWYVTDIKLDTERAGRESDRLAYKAAQEEYEANALRVKMETEERNRQRADQADERYAALLGQYNASLLRYQNAQRSVSRSDLSGTPAAPESGDGPGGDTLLPEEIIISVDDARICAVNTARIKIVQEWATEGK
jgi:hypothetical protein